MAGRTQRLAETARRNRVELVEARLTRRDLAKLGLITAAGYLVTKLGLSTRASGTTRSAPESPATTPWVEELPVPPVAIPREPDALGIRPKQRNQAIAGEAGREAHQHWELFDVSAADLHLLENRVTGVRWHRELPPDECWCWNGVFPGPRIHARVGRPTLVRLRNQLPTLDLHRGYGRPTTATHLHGGHTAAESDGDPLVRVEPGQWLDQLHLNRRAGFSDPATGAIDDPRVGVRTASYHDQSLGFGAQNSYRGNVGTYHVFDEFDSGHEADPNPNAWRLPSGDFDVPLVLHDRVFDAHGRGYFDLFDLDGIVGDKVTVNGRIQPFFRVARRKYRFRLHNVGPCRSYTLHLSNDLDLVQVARDGAMLPAPYVSKDVSLAVGQSADVIVDFGRPPMGIELYLVDVEARDALGPATRRPLTLAQGARLLRFDMDATLDTRGDPSRVPEHFFSPIPAEAWVPTATRTFVIEREDGGWTVNGRPFDPEFMAATPTLGSAEAWNFVNRSGGWLRALQLPMADPLVLSRDGRAPATGSPGRGGVLRLAPGETVSVLRRFRDFRGRYSVHSRYGAEGDQGLTFMWRVVS